MNLRGALHAVAVIPLTLSMTEPVVTKKAETSNAAVKLKAMRTSFEAGQFELCLNQAGAAKKAAKSVEPWIVSLEMDCALKLKPGKGTADHIDKVLTTADSKLTVFGPWAASQRQQWAKLRLLAIETDLKTNRSRAWKHVEKLAPAASAVLNDADRAKLWRMAGEILFTEQKTEAARDFYRRSLDELDQPELRDRLRALDQKLIDQKVTSAATSPAAVIAKAPEGSAAEVELYNRITTNLKTGDLVAAADDAVKLMNDYPGSTRAKWAADRTLESFISVSEKSGDSMVNVRDAILKSMESAADSDRVAEWARVSFNKGLWAQSARLARVAATRQSGNRATKTLEIALDALYAIDDFKGVRAVGEELVEKHSGTSAARLAQYRMGLAAYRQGDFTRAANVFEKFLATQQLDNFELQTRYWLWRSLQQLKNEAAANEQAEILTRRFAFSYYGLRAKLETGGGKMQWPKETPKLQENVWLIGEEKAAWDRALLLISAGWFEAAQEELKQLPAATTPDAKALRARVWGTAKNFVQASRLANQAWDEKFELRRIDLMRVVWPEEHKALFESAAKAKSVDPLMTRSLTKQESGYNPRAVSTSNALGLMQMIPPTAREIADDLKMGKLNLPDDMFEPTRNIPMGTHYIAKMITQFKGHVPLALAAYNAGPTRVDRWLKSRPSLQGLEATRSSSPELELWMDEFPYSETSFYVKAILRNWLLYRLIEEDSVAVQEPFWK